MVYTPGNSYDQWPPGIAKRIKAGSDLVLQMHYTANGTATEDRTRIGIVFAKEPPKQAVLSLQMSNDRFVIPPGDSNYRVQVSGTLPNDALLISMFPHMHLRGKGFEYLITGPNGHVETLLKVNHYDFQWQLNYRLAAAAAHQSGHASHMDWLLRQLAEQSRQSRSDRGGSLRRTELGRDDDRLLRCRGGCEHRQAEVLRTQTISSRYHR